MSVDVIDCRVCSRRTPSARAVCLYCGASLAVNRIENAPPQRAIDSFERAYNTVLDPSRGRTSEASEPALASALKIDLDEARALIAAGKRMPVARCHNPQEAELIAALVRTCGLGALVIPDEDLKLDIDLARARRITRGSGELSVQHAGGSLAVPLPELRLLVVGVLRSTRVDYVEGLPGIGAQSRNVLDSAEFRSEEMLLDVYADSLETSFRIKSDAFDYSGLVWPLSFRAEINFQVAISSLHEAAPHVMIDEDFARIRRLLSRVWPERSRTEARGVKRAGLALRPVAQSSLISDNRDQFDRYSRLIFLSLSTAVGPR